MRNKEERVWEMTELWGKTTEKLWEIPLCYFISHNHLSDNKQVIPKVWEYEKWIW